MNLTLNNPNDWQLLAGQWTDNNGAISVTRDHADDGDGLQAFSLAFYKPKAYAEVEAEFTVRMPTNHADLGFIVRAQDPTHYYLIHFPQCGQGYRAQHFWAALSKADGSGYLRLLKVNHVQRVPSNPLGIANRARVKVAGDRIQVWVNGHPALDVRDGTYQAGRIGLAGFLHADFGKVTVTAGEVPAAAWDDRLPQVKNWFVPFPDHGSGQGGVSLVKSAQGTLLCLFSASYSDLVNAMGAGQAPTKGRFLARSTDQGKTWSVAPAPAELIGDLESLKNGRLISVHLAQDGGQWSESTDDGRTWCTPVPISFKGPAGLKRFDSGFPLELKNGTLLRFGVGGHPSSGEPITRWGACHCQAFAMRSTDGGRTWSAPVNLDGDAPDMGNLDLTEPIAFETADGRIMCLIRPIYSPWMWETWSNDGGKTWGPAFRGPFAGWAPSPPVRTHSGAVIFPTRFPGLTIHLTRDDGQTWDEGTYIDSSVWAMGALCEIEPDLVLFAYMDSHCEKVRMQYLCVTPQGLMPVNRESV